MRIGTFLYDRIRLIVLLLVILAAAYMQFGIRESLLFAQVLVFATLVYFLHEYWMNYSFYKRLDDIINRQEGVATPWTGEQELFCDAIDRLSENHREKYAALKQKKVDHEVFIDLIVHEMKTPLTAMQLLLEDFKSEDIDRLSREVKRLDNHLTTALYYSRKEEVKNDYKLVPVNVKRFIHHVLEENADDLISSNIGIKTHGLDENIVTDPKWLAYIVGQILRNAYSSPEYGITSIEISLEIHDAWCDLIIKDDGIGIQEHEVQRIFDKAYAGDRRRSSKKSSGLGLYLSDQIAGQLGLNLSVESSQGHFTSFKIERLRKEMKDY